MKKVLISILLLALLLPTFLSPAAAQSLDADPVFMELLIESYLLNSDDLAYWSLDFKELSRYPEKYQKEPYSFTGRVVQVLGSREDGFQMRIATKGDYDNVVYVMLFVNPGFNILEDDNLTIYSKYYDLYSYETVMGGTVTLPLFVAHLVELND